MKKQTLYKIIIPGCCFLISFLIGLLVTGHQIRQVVLPDTLVVKADTPVIKDSFVPLIIEHVECSEPSLMSKAGKYAFSINGAQANKANVSWYYQLFESKQETSPIAESNNGEFTNINPSKDGTYYLLTTATLAADTARLGQTLSGFNPLSKEVKKLSAHDVQQLINRHSPTIISQRHPSFAPGFKIIVFGEGQPYTSFQEIANLMKTGVWTSVQVTGVHYDTDGRIDRVNMTRQKIDISDSDDE